MSKDEKQKFLPYHYACLRLECLLLSRPTSANSEQCSFDKIYTLSGKVGRRMILQVRQNNVVLFSCFPFLSLSWQSSMASYGALHFLVCAIYLYP